MALPFSFKFNFFFNIFANCKVKNYNYYVMLSQGLNEREKVILRYIIQQFILTASPVGSRNITKKYDVGVSAATVRNIMSDLEDTGFINHPHTSAGRIPTDKGYRFYVDSLMEISHLNNIEKKLIQKSLEQKEIEKDELIKSTAKLLSSITRQLAYISYPRIDNAVLEKIQLFILSSTRLLVVVNIKSGLVKTVTLELKFEIDANNISSVESILNEKLSGLSFKEIRATINERFTLVGDQQKPILRLFIDSLDKIFRIDNKIENLYVTGAKDLIKQPEFEGPESFQSIIELIEDKDIIVHIMEKTSEFASKNVCISIGNENEHQKLQDYSFISKEYKMGEVAGTLGVIGPKRMEYSKIAAFVTYISQIFSEILRQEN